jgi:hypothetical protein
MAMAWRQGVSRGRYADSAAIAEIAAIPGLMDISAKL